MKNIIKYFSILFALVIGIFVLDSTIANAYQFYYNDSSALGVQYNGEGYVKDVKDEVVIYGQQVKAGYLLSSDTSLRIKEFKVKVGDSSYTSVDSSYYKIEKVDAANLTSVPSGYSSNMAVNKNTDKIIVYMQKILDNYFSNYTQSNDISITITLERKQLIVFVPSWKDYDSVSYYNGSGSKSNISYKKTSEDFLKSQVTGRVTKTFTSQHKLSTEKYYNKNSEKSSYSYEVVLPFKVQSGTANLQYSYVTYRKGSVAQTQTTVNRTSTCGASFYAGSSKSAATLGYVCFSEVFADEIYRKVTFAKVNISVKDRYGIRAVVNDINVSDEYLTIATETPKINKIKISTLAESPVRGAVKLNVDYDLSNLDYTNNTYTVNLTSITFKVGSGDVTMDDGNSYVHNDFKSDKKISSSYTIYSNQGTGVISFKKFTASITDKYGNTNTHTNDTTITNEISNIELISNVEGSTFSSTYMYYYFGDRINFKLNVTGLKGLTIAEIKLKDSKGSTYTLYNTLITKTSEAGEEQFDLTSGLINIDTTKEWVKVILCDIKEPTNDGVQSHGDYEIEHLMYFNKYVELTTTSKIVNSDKFVISGIEKEEEAVSVTSTNITLENMSKAQLELNACAYKENDSAGYVECSYHNKKSLDGYAVATIGRGTIKLANGIRNEELTLELVENKRNPSITINPKPQDDSEGVYEELSIKTYFYKGTKSLKLELNDGYCGNGALYYSFNDQEFEKISFTCGDNVLEDAEFNIPLPSNEGTYNLKYYISTDENDNGEYTSEYTYIFRSELEISDSAIVINDGQELSVNAFNSIKVLLDDISASSMLDKYRIQFEGDLSYSQTSVALGDNTFNYNVNNRNELASLNGEVVNFTITLIDKLENAKSYEYSIVIDTITPYSPDPRVNKVDGEYIISIENYDEYTDGDTIVIAYSDEELSCVKGENETCEFNIGTYTIYSLKSTDKAGNTNGVSTYTTEEAKVQIANSYLSISPFTSIVYNPKTDVNIRVYKYAYSLGELQDYTSITKICTSVTTVNCYSKYSLTNDSMYVLPDGDELNIKMSIFTLESNYSYVFIVNLGNSSLPLSHKDGGYPRLDIEYRDEQGPSLVEESVNSNPLVVSDSVGSLNSYVFNFTISDNNLDSNSYFEYLIVNKTYVNNYTITNTTFKEYLSYCPRNLSTYINKCGQWSSEPIKYSQVNENNASGIISINKNGRMINNTSYLLFVKSYDSYGNYTIEVINEFINVSSSINVYYKDGDDGSKTLSTDGVVKTVKDNANLFVEVKSELLANVDIVSVMLNSEVINIDSNGYKVGKGQYSLIVKDSLGNVETIIVYCGALSKPEIKVYNYYNSSYYEITSNTDYAYNNATLNNLYVKIDATNLQSFSVKYGDENPLYDKNTTQYQTITGEEYGIKLSELISSTSGTVTIKAIGDGGQESVVNLVVDNQIPTISIIGDTQEDTIYLFDIAHNISSDGNNRYTLDEANYRYELNYNYLFNRLSLRIDGKSFDDIKSVSNVIVKLDNVRILDYATPIATLADGSTISVEYFDDAGNVGQPLYIDIKIIDKEAPILEGLEESRVVEANTVISLIDEMVTASDNFDNPENINVLLKLNNETLFDAKFDSLKLETYKFSLVGKYTLTFVLTDTHGNTSEVAYTQVIDALDTSAPVIDDEFSLTGMNLANTFTMDLPKFKDSDVDETVYYPSIIEFYMGEKLVDEKYYTLTISENVVSVKFKDEASTGTYTMVIKAMDIYGNTSVESANFILTDITAPIINVYVNGEKVVGNEVRVIYGDEKFTLNYEAIDAHDGKVSVTRTGDSVNVNKQGSYEIVLTAKDKSNVKAERRFVVIVEPDTNKPVIEKVTIGTSALVPSNQSMPMYNELNYKYAYINVVAKDNAGIEKIEIDYDGYKTINNSEVRLIDGRPFVIIVKVSDIAGNVVTNTYYVNVDNSTPKIEGVKDKQVYDDGVSITISDLHLNSVVISKNNTIIDEQDIENETTYNASFTECGIYEIVAYDSYKNEVKYLFEIKETLVHKIKYSNGEIKHVANNATFLVRAEVDVSNNLVVYLDNNSQVEDTDEIYILISYPGSDELKEVYSVSGRYYLNNNKITLSGTLIEGESNESTLNNVGREYYAYAMVIKANASNNLTEENQESTNEFSETLIKVLSTLGFIAIIILILFLIIKFRRKVRTV